MNKDNLPKDSRAYAEQAYREKEALRRKRARMSFKRKLEALDRLREMAKRLPKLDSQEDTNG